MGTQLVNGAVGFKPDVGLADSYASYEVGLAGVSPAGVNSCYLHGGKGWAVSAAYGRGLEIDDVVMGRAAFIEEDDATVVEVEGDGGLWVVLQAMPELRLLENVLKDYYRVLVAPTEELLVFRLYGNDGKLYLCQLSEGGAS